jgi:CheY-like chemotaxis protein
MVVDDEPGLRKVVRDGLERAGHEVETAVDGDEAIGFFEEKEFDLIVTDLTMPKKGGLDLVREIRGLRRADPGPDGPPRGERRSVFSTPAPTTTSPAWRRGAPRGCGPPAPPRSR